MQKIFEGKVVDEEIKEGSVVLMVIPSQKLIDINTQILKWYISEKKCGVVYVTVNKPFSTLITGFQREKIDTSKIFIIDAVSPRVGREENAVFIGSPKELTNISITTASTIKKLKEAKILIFDSISTLLAYNDFETVKKFVCFISNEMKNWKMTFVMTCVKDIMDKDKISELKDFADNVVEIE
jgi:KaiC/GvpD/RAD55 family RecA-like ATPase